MIRSLAGSDIESVTLAETLDEALEVTAGGAIDLLFLDLNLGGRNGFRLLDAAVASRFQTIVVSAHHEQALRAFEFGVTDFIAKPFTAERLRKALDRAFGRTSLQPGRTRCLAVRKGAETRVIPIDRVTYISGADDFSELHLDDGSAHLHQKTLAQLAEMLPDSFVRIHRSFIVNLAGARGMGGTTLVLADGRALPVGRTYRGSLRAKMGFSSP
jgi:DNA-binding LytR/AlgR family response regulator